MPFDDLRSFLRTLEKQGELKRIPFAVDPYLEITEFADRSVKQNGPALLFEKPKGSSVPLAINLFASERRMEIALGVSNVEEIAARIAGFLQMQKPEGFVDTLKLLPKLKEISSAFPRTVHTGLCKEVVLRGDFSLDSFPILHCWPGDGGRFITLPMVFSRNPETGKRNCGMYRMQVFDPKTTGMHWQKHKQGAEHYRRLVAEGKQTHMPVAVAIGSDPATIFSRHSSPAARYRRNALRRLPARKSRRNGEVRNFRSRSSGQLRDCSRRLSLDLGELRREGPFGDHTGFYSLDDDYPVFHIECITHRKNPVYASTIVGPPPMEDFYMGKAIERIFLPLMRMQLPEIRDICMPAEGVFHNLILISIRKSYPGQARK